MRIQNARIVAIICTVFGAIATGVGASVNSNDDSDLGTLGPLYEIAEPDFVDEMVAVAKEREASGEWLRGQQEASKRIIASIREPRPIEGISKTMVARTRYWDPSIVVEENIVNDKGQVIVPKGTVKNPLDVINIEKSMLFIDGRDAAQIALAKSAIAKMGDRVTPILVAGPVIALMEKWKRPVYFDQQGLLSTRFGIKQVPAWVYQEGKKMRIDEVLAPSHTTGEAQ